jgi:anti-sigma factor RsiW
MTCQDSKDLMMAYLDNEMDETDRRKFEEHIASCGQCARQMEEFKSLKQMTDSIALAEPEDRVWEQYWGSVYNRMERGVGWIVSSIAAILLLIYGGFMAIEWLIEDPALSMLLKAGLLAFLGGVAVLFVSVLRERIYFWSRDRYKDVRR